MAHASQPRASILIFGAATAAPKRAHELRLRGHATWVASTEDELRWLLDVAGVRADYALVELTDVPPERIPMLANYARLADVAALPVVLVGANDDERRLFSRILAMLPRDPGNSAIISTLPTVQSRTART